MNKSICILLTSLILFTGCSNPSPTQKNLENEKVSDATKGGEQTGEDKKIEERVTEAVIASLPVMAKDYSIALDSKSNIFLSNNFAIQKLNSDLIEEAFAGDNTFVPPNDLAGKKNCQGFADGNGTSAKFCHPGAMAFDNDGNLIVADNYNFRIRKVTTDAKVSTIAGGSYNDFSFMSGLTIDSKNNIYVTDDRKIKKITPKGEITVFAGSGIYGYKDGNAETAEFNNLFGIIADKNDNLYVSDAQRIRKITPEGQVSTFAGDKVVNEHKIFGELRGITIDKKGNLFVCDFLNNAIFLVTPDGKVTKIAGNAKGTIDGTAKNASFFHPYDIAVDNNKNILYVVQVEEFKIRKVTY